MKRIFLPANEIEEEDETLYIGTAREIASLWNNFNKREIAEPSHCDRPHFTMWKMYGLSVSYDTYRRKDVMYVMSADTVLKILYDII